MRDLVHGWHWIFVTSWWQYGKRPQSAVSPPRRKKTPLRVEVPEWQIVRLGASLKRAQNHCRV